MSHANRKLWWVAAALLLAVVPRTALAEWTSSGTVKVETEDPNGAPVKVEVPSQFSFIFDPWGYIDAVSVSVTLPLDPEAQRTATLTIDVDLQPQQVLYYTWVRNLTIRYGEQLSGVEQPGVFAVEGTLRLLEATADKAGLTLRFNFDVEVQEQLIDGSWNTIRHFHDGEASTTTLTTPPPTQTPTAPPTTPVPVIAPNDGEPDIIVGHDISNGCNAEEQRTYDDYDEGDEPAPDSYDNGGGCTSDPGYDSSSPGPSCDGSDNGSYDSEGSSAPDGSCSLRGRRCRGKSCRLPRAYAIALRLSPFFFAFLFVLGLKRRSIRLARSASIL